MPNRKLCVKWRRQHLKKVTRHLQSSGKILEVLSARRATTLCTTVVVESSWFCPTFVWFSAECNGLVL